MTSTLKNIAGLFNDRWRDPSVCAGCGNPFTCGAKLSGCWCSEIKLTDKTREELRSKYSGCLCRNCLESTSAETADHKFVP